MAKRLLSVFLAVLMLCLHFSVICSAEFESGAREVCRLEKTDSENRAAKAGHADTDSVRIVVEVQGEPALSACGSVKSAEGARRALISKQNRAIEKIERKIGHSLSGVRRFSLLFNGFSFDGTAADIDAINAEEGLRAFVSPEYGLIEPEMSTSSQIVGATYAWNLEYTGKGMVICVIDTGIRETHEAFSVVPDDAKYDLDALTAKLGEVGEFLHAAGDAEQIFKNGKIPFGYNYNDDNPDTTHTASDHGTHVAGIAAGNNGNGFRGIAYDAQIAVMQVFKPTGGADWDVIMAALEDCATLGFDSVNMSLGSSCGFCTYADEATEKAMTLLADAGVLVASASGNDASTARNNRWSGYQLAQNPDMGVTSSPGTLFPCMSVASSDNRAIQGGYIRAYNQDIAFFEPVSGAQSFLTLEGERTFVDCGEGLPDEIPDSVSGNIALIKRGGLTFTEKAENAYLKGAAGVIVFNSEQGVLTSISVSSPVPFVTLSGTDGEFLLLNAEGGTGTLEVRTGEVTLGNDKISAFSSVGTTADLKIKPEITAPGGNIYSCTGFDTDSSYAQWNGTSMATPHVAGGMVIVKEYLKKAMPHLSQKELAEVTNCVLMSSATMLSGELVSAQGAGLMNLEAALESISYLSVDGMRPKIELDESEDYKWEFDLEVTNFSDSDAEYTIKHKYMIRKAEDKRVENETLSFMTGSCTSVTSLVDATGETAVTLSAGEKKTLHFSIDASRVMEMYGASYPLGALLEGFVILKSGEETLSAPLLGYMGDWDAPSLFDRGFYWQSVTGELNLQSNGAGNCTYNLAATQRNSQLSGVGFNPFMSMVDIDYFNPDWGAISPDGDGNCDTVSNLRFAMLRNLKTFNIDVETPSGTIEEYVSEPYDYRKEFYYSGGGYTYTNYELGYAGEGLSEGETAYIRLYGTLDHEGFTPEANECAEWVIPVTLDTTAPVVYPDGDRIAVYDEHYIACTAVYADAEMVVQTSAKGYFEKERGITEYVEGQSGIVYLLAGDYAGNTAYYCVNTDTGEVTRLDGAPEEYILIFRVDGSVYYSKRYREGDVIDTSDLPADPEKTGYTFIGWDGEIPEEMPAHDVVLNALFQINSYTVTFCDIDGTVLSVQTVEYMQAAQAPEAPAHEGHTFMGWDCDFSAVTDDMTVTAVYEREEYSVIFVDMDMVSVLSLQKVAYGDAAQAPDIPVHEGYTFEKWDKDFSCVTSDMTIFAQYARNFYTVTFYDMDGQTVLSVQRVEHGKAAQAPEEPEHEGYTFLGWSADFECVTEDMSIYALFTRNALTGDVNGDGKVNTADAVLILKYAAEMIELDEEALLIADVNRSGGVNTSDAVLVLKHAAGMEELN